MFDIYSGFIIWIAFHSSFVFYKFWKRDYLQKPTMIRSILCVPIFHKIQDEEISIHFNYTALSTPMLSKRTKAKHVVFPMKNRLRERKWGWRMRDNLVRLFWRRKKGICLISLHWFSRMKGKEINGKSSEKNEKRGHDELS